MKLLNSTNIIFYSFSCSPVFNSFLANLSQVLDQNHLIGAHVLESVMPVILYAPNRNKTGVESYQHLIFNYSLWYLACHVRRNWLMAMVVILYKYTYTEPPLSSYVNSAIKIVINSLKEHFHECKRIPMTTVFEQQSNSRDASQPSAGGDSEEKKASTEPPSPIFQSEVTSENTKDQTSGQNVTGFTPKMQHHAFKKYQDSSLEADETESELVAIPESDFSDSTLHGSSAPVNKS